MPSLQQPSQPFSDLCTAVHATVASPAAMPSNDHAKSATYMCEKCGATFGRRYHLQRHVRTVCTSSSSCRANTTVYTCTKCERNFDRRWFLTRHERTACTIVNEPSSPNISKREEDTTRIHPLVTEEDTINPPARLPFPDALSTDLLDVVREHWSAIRTRVAKGPLQCRLNYRLTTLDTTVLEEPLKIMFEEQSTAFKINLSYGFVLRNKDTGIYRYYHSSCNCCGKIIRIIDDPIGCVRATPLPVYIKKNKAVIVLETEPIHHKWNNDNLCLFRCLPLHRGCDLYRLKPAVKTLYEVYDQGDVPMEEFARVTLDDLYRVETTFQTNVCVYKLVKSDAEDGKSTAELVRRSLCHYSDTMYLNLHETHFSFIQDVRMYCHSYRCRKCGESLWKDAYRLRSHERTCTGVCVSSRELVFTPLEQSTYLLIAQ